MPPSDSKSTARLLVVVVMLLQLSQADYLPVNSVRKTSPLDRDIHQKQHAISTFCAVPRHERGASDSIVELSSQRFQFRLSSQRILFTFALGHIRAPRMAEATFALSFPSNRFSAHGVG